MTVTVAPVREYLVSSGNLAKAHCALRAATGCAVVEALCLGAQSLPGRKKMLDIQSLIDDATQGTGQRGIGASLGRNVLLS